MPQAGGAPRVFWIPLAIIAALGTAARFAWAETHGLIQTGIVIDQRFYHGVANAIARGDGYVLPGTTEPTAAKPPLYPLLLAAESVLGGDSTHAHRLLGPLLGGATIVLLAVLGRSLGGNTVGLIAGALVAVDVQLWVIDAQILSEVLYGVLLALMLLLAYRMRGSPTLRNGIALGLVTGLAALTRPEAAGMGVLLGIVLLWTHRRAALAPVLTGVAACLLVIAPWTIRNWIVFDTPVFLSQQSAENLAGANCPQTYYGPDTGSWRFDCVTPRAPGETEPEWASALRKKGLDYARDHAGRVPVVLVARVSRTWGLRAPSPGFGFTRSEALREAVIAWIVLVLGGVGAFVARRRGVPVGILLVPAVTVTVAAIVQFGLLRYRYSADLALLVLGAFAVDAAARAIRSRRGARRDVATRVTAAHD